jgi:hypothetical protein
VAVVRSLVSVDACIQSLKLLDGFRSYLAVLDLTEHLIFVRFEVLPAMTQCSLEDSACLSHYAAAHPKDTDVPSNILLCQYYMTSTAGMVSFVIR